MNKFLQEFQIMKSTECFVIESTKLVVAQTPGK